MKSTRMIKVVGAVLAIGYLILPDFIPGPIDDIIVLIIEHVVVQEISKRRAETDGLNHYYAD